MPRRGLACLLAILAVAGCGGGDDSGTDEPRKAGEQGDFDVYEVRSHGFTISVPNDWRAASGEKVLEDEQLEEFSKENPDLAPALEALDDPNSPVKFVAFDPDVEDGFATNVNVVVERLPKSVTFDQYSHAGLDQVRRLAAGAVASRPVTLPAGRAQQLDYELELKQGGDTKTVATLQYALLGDGKGYVITFSTLPGQKADYEEAFREIAESFRVG